MTWTYKYKPSLKSPVITITGKDFDDLYKNTINYFKRKGININSESIKQQILRQNNLPQNDQKKSHSLVGNLSLSDAMNGAKASIKNILGQNASNLEIIRRAKICATSGPGGTPCPKMTGMSDCMVCGGSKKVATFINTIKARFGFQIDIPAVVQKKYCDVCSCALSLMVVTRYHDLKEESAGKVIERPDHCWLKPSSPNFTKE